MRRIVELKEREFRDKDEYDYAPIDFDDAMDSYERVLEMVGEISAEVIAPNAESVDREGPTVANGRVTYARGTQENLDAVRKAGLMGMAMPRRYGGLNFPIVPYIMAADIVSRADSKISGDCRIAPKPFTNLGTKNSTSAISLACAREKQCRWT